MFMIRAYDSSNRHCWRVWGECCRSHLLTQRTENWPSRTQAGGPGLSTWPCNYNYNCDYTFEYNTLYYTIILHYTTLYYTIFPAHVRGAPRGLFWPPWGASRSGPAGNAAHKKRAPSLRHAPDDWHGCHWWVCRFTVTITINITITITINYEYHCYYFYYY